MDEIDWKAVQLEKIQEMQRLGEKILEAQFATATAADQRAMTMAAMVNGAAAAVAAGLIAMYATGNLNAHLFWAGVAGGGLLGLSLICLIRAAMPTRWFLPGNHPKNFWGDDVLAADMRVVLGGQVEHDQVNIDHNATLIARNAALLKFGMLVAALAPIAAILTAAGVAWAVGE